MLCTAVMYRLSRSGRSSRSTLMGTKFAFRNAAISSFSNDSRSMTWHQWQVEYPMERKIGLFSRFAVANASLSQGFQSTGLWACCRRYGLFSWMSRFVCLNSPVLCFVSMSDFPPQAGPARTSANNAILSA